MSPWLLASLAAIVVCAAGALVPLLLSARKKASVLQPELAKLEHNLAKLEELNSASAVADTPERKIARLETRLNSAARMRRADWRKR